MDNLTVEDSHLVVRVW